MRILGVRHVDGPNVYIYKPTLMARIDLESLAERESYEFCGFADRLLRALPGLREHHCAKGEPGGFVDRLYQGTYFGHIVEHVAIEMACLAGLDVHYGKTLYAGDVGQYDIVMECKSYDCQRALLFRAVDLVQAMAEGQDVDVMAVIDPVVRECRHTMLGPSTQAIVDAALQRGIPVRRVTTGSIVQLGYGAKRKLVEATITSQTSALAVDVACDKALTKQLLEDAGIAVPRGGVATSLEEAMQWFGRLGGPVALKPLHGNQGRGVGLDVRTQADLYDAYRIASQWSDQVVVEQFVPGRNLRLLVVGGTFVAASERVPARVMGDGMHSVAQLVELVNAHPDRGVGHEKPLTRMALDELAHMTLAKHGRRPTDVPAMGEVVFLRESANLSTGGEAIDVTDTLHPSYRRMAERVARIIGLDVCGIDMVVEAPEAPYHPATASVIEVNAAPGIRMHEHPSNGFPRNVGAHIVDMLFPAGANGRIPIVSITGTNGKTTTTRLIGHALSLTGQTVGMTTTGGVYIDGRMVVEGDTTGPDSARIVLSDPAVEAAVLETARGGIVRGGLGYDKANVAVMTNISLDHVGQDGIENLEDLLHVKSLVAECVFDDGLVVLNADDEALAKLGKRLKPRIAYFAMSQDNPVLKRHLACGGTGYYVNRGWIVEARGHLSWEVASVKDVPLTMDGTAEFHVANCLAATAALRGMGVTRQQVADGLRSFQPTTNNRGRCMIYDLPRDVRVVLDYGHNADGFDKVGTWLRQCPHRRLIGVIGVPGDRSDAVVRAATERLAAHFDAFIVKEDHDKRGRRDGEIAEMMAAHIRSVAPHIPVSVVLDESTALQNAIGLAEPGDIIAAFYEHLDGVQSVVLGAGGVQTPTLTSRNEEPRAAVLS